MPRTGKRGRATYACAIPKVNPLHAKPRREREKAEYRVLRPRVREDTYLRDGGRCRCPCSKLLMLHTDDPYMLANIHERTGGSQRRVEAVDVSLKSTITLASGCHEAVERHKLNIRILDDELGFNGPVEFSGRLATGRELPTPFVSHPSLSGAWRID